jgi:hypothetical protein
MGKWAYDIPKCERWINIPNIVFTMSVKEADIITFCIHDSHTFIQFVSIYNLFDFIRPTYPIYERGIPTGNICIFIN